MEEDDSRRSTRRSNRHRFKYKFQTSNSVFLRTRIPNAEHYVGYVEDDETPEMIMKKFEEFERVVPTTDPIHSSTHFALFSPSVPTFQEDLLISQKLNSIESSRPPAASASAKLTRRVICYQTMTKSRSNSFLLSFSVRSVNQTMNSS